MPEPTARVYAYTKRDAETGSTDHFGHDQGREGKDRRRAGRFSSLSAPLTGLTKKNKKFEWTERCERNFQELKRRLTSAPILIVPSEDEEFTIYCDASKMGLGAVLMQTDKVVAYASRQLKDHEKNYPTHDMELAARRWLELVKDYDCEILYHPGKANKVADALSRRVPAALMSIQALPKALQEDVQKLELELIMGQMSTLTLQPTIFEGMKGSQELDPDLTKIREKMVRGENSEFGLSPDGILHFKGRLCIPNDPEMRNQILSEAHSTPYSVHPGTSKMYKDLRGHFWWPGMKKDVIEFISKCLTLDRLTKSAHFIPIRVTYSLEQLAELYVKEISMGTKLKFSTAFHPQTDGQSERTIQTLEDMLRACVLEFKGSWSKYLPLIEFSYNNSYQATIGAAPYEALYGRKCRSPVHWYEVGESLVVAPDFVEATT
ncbi:hypothetical protein UlMin_020499 [Ulmus minor]